MWRREVGRSSPLSPTRTIAWREFSTTVRRGSYLLATFGTPLFFLLIAGITAIPSLVALRRELDESQQVAVVDEAGLLTGDVLPAGEPGENSSTGVIDELALRVLEGRRHPVVTRVALYASREEADGRLRAGELESFYVIPQDYVETGRLEYHGTRRQFLWSPTGRGGPIRPLLIEGLLAGKVEAARRERVRKPVAEVRSLVLGPDGRMVEEDPRGALARIVVPFAFAFILMLSIFIASGYLIQGLVEEKSNRVIELLLSSVTPGDLIAGKLVGLGGAGLLQLAVWVGLAMLPVALVGWIEVSATVVVLSAAYYLLGFVFFGSIMAGLGCIAGGTQESQQFASLWSVVAVLPMLFSPLILEAPNGVLSRVLSYVPVTCPITMIMRCAVGEVVWWEVPLSLGVMLAATYLSLRASARLFRVGLLVYGQRPTLGQLLASLREA